MFKILTFIIISSVFISKSYADPILSSKEHDFKLETIMEGFENPWAIDFLPDKKILLTERSGKLHIIENGKSSNLVSGLPEIVAKGQGGLLDIALDPNYLKNHIIYLSYTGKGKGGIGTEVIKGKLVDKQLIDTKIIFKLLPKTNSGYHFGSRLMFTKDEKLLITLGDRGNKKRAQDLTDHAGSLIRINKDGSIPKDNPFINKKGVRPEIYTYGSRNIQGIAIRPNTNEIWSVEHGPQGGDELNIMLAGANYGWPTITYGVNYVTGTKIGEGTHKENMEQPKHVWIPSIAPSSLLFYSGEQFPNWKNNIFVSSLAFGQLVRLKLEDDKVVIEERLVNDEVGRIREVQQGLDGYIYIITDEVNGKLMRLVPVK